MQDGQEPIKNKSTLFACTVSCFQLSPCAQFQLSLLPSPMDHLVKGGGSPPWPVYYIAGSLHAEQCYQPANQEKHTIICVANIPWLESNANALTFTRLIYGNHTSSDITEQGGKQKGKVGQDMETELSSISCETMSQSSSQKFSPLCGNLESQGLSHFNHND